MGSKACLKGDFYFMNDKYKVRAELIARGYDKLVAKLDRQSNQNLLNGVIEDPELDSKYIDVLFAIGSGGIKECQRLNRNKDNRTYKLRKRVKELIEYPCLFLTATFRDDVLDNTSAKTRREYIIDFLNSFDNFGYIANIDFGVDDRYTKREHYHILVAVEYIDNSNNKLWHYGNLDIERVRVNGEEKEKTIKAVPKYITKLVNHAIKDSAKKVRLIYSRRKPNNNANQHPLKTNKEMLDPISSEVKVGSFVWVKNARGKNVACSPHKQPNEL